MNTKQFKNIIKECVRDVIKEELSDILKEAVLSNSKTRPLLENNTPSFNFTSNDVIHKQTNGSLKNTLDGMYGFNKPQAQPKVVETVESGGNKFMEFFQQTAAEMTPQDRAALTNLG